MRSRASAGCTRSQSSVVRMERFGFVGLPNAGKSSLYNALAGGGALAAPYAFATRDPNVGVAKVPDHRLEALAAMSSSRNVVPAAVQFVDIGGLVEGASKGEGLGNRFLANIRESDAVVYVLRAFEDEDVPGPSDPLEHLSVLELELTLADIESVESQLEKRRKAARADKSLMPEVEALDAALAILGEGTPLYRSDLDEEARTLLRPRFLRTAYHLLGLRTFLTTGEKESRAWTFRAGWKAPQAAGVIHTDFERGFIRAEVIDWAELIEIGSWSKAREVGKMRVEGKDYVVADGDVMEFRFNV